MKLLLCWRCKTEIPMLEDDEYRQVMRLIGTGTEGDTWERRFDPMLREYERMTGFRETNHNAVFHHQLSLYGPPCSNCGKPLRTPQARFCVGCGQAVTK